jgi:glycosyltransferase involved in cell wall biosynthesis
MRRILYDYSYATRGRSGIPNDTRSVSQILLSEESNDVDFLVFPRSFVKKYPLKLSIIETSEYVSASFKMNAGRTALPVGMMKFFSLAQAISVVPKLKIVLISDAFETQVKRLISNSNMSLNFPKRVFVVAISNLARFARPSYLGLFQFKTNSYDYYIQQQCDPIKVSKNTRHIVRLHDILPITNPQFFDDLAVTAFSKSLKKMLSQRDLIWVMDSRDSATEFQRIFGSGRKVHVIPCEVGAHLRKHVDLKTVKKNQILVVNTIEPRKNVLSAINAFRLALNNGLLPKNYKLFIVGGFGWQEEQLIRDLKGGKFGRNVIYYEDCGEEDLARLLNESKLLMSATYAEGFSLPPLEGMLFGCLPVVSRIPQHFETMGSHAIYFDEDVESIGVALKKAHLLASRNPKLKTKLNQHVNKNFSRPAISIKWNELFHKLENT